MQNSMTSTFHLPWYSTIFAAGGRDLDVYLERLGLEQIDEAFKKLHVTDSCGDRDTPLWRDAI